MECALYVRQSKDWTGEELGVQRQEADCRALALARGWKVLTVHADNDTSGAGKVKRPGFEALLEEVQSGRVGAVVAWSLDRLTRNARDRLRLLEIGKEHGLVVSLARGSDLDLATPAGRLTADILGSVAQHEIEQKSDRQKRAALQRAELGKPPTGVRLTGYEFTGEIRKDEADFVKQVFARFAEGDSIRSLVAWLQSEGVKTRTEKPWASTSVRRMLTNPRYAGRAIYMGKANGKAGNWTPIIKSETFDLVQARLSDPRRRTQVGTDRKHLGSGMYLCGVCSPEDQPDIRVPLVGFSKGRYYCQTCGMSRTGRHIDALITELVRRRLAEPDLLRILAEPENRRISELTDEMERLRARLRQTEFEFLNDDIDDPVYKIKRDRIRAQLLEVRNKLLRASRGPRLLHDPDPVAAFDDASLGLKQATISALLEVRLLRVPRGQRGLDEDSVTIYWRGEPRESSGTDPR